MTFAKACLILDSAPFRLIPRTVMTAHRRTGEWATSVRGYILTLRWEGEQGKSVENCRRLKKCSKLPLSSFFLSCQDTQMWLNFLQFFNLNTQFVKFYCRLSPNHRHAFCSGWPDSNICTTIRPLLCVPNMKLEQQLHLISAQTQIGMR